MNSGGLVLIALAVLAAALLVGIAWFVFSRISDRSHSFPCAYREDESAPWSRGLLCYDTGRLDHFGGGGPRRSPQHRWQRATLELGMARSQDPVAVPWLAAPVVAVACDYSGERFELALGLEHYTALRSWLESVPPGWNANVA